MRALRGGTGPAIAATGLALAVLGTFLPWLRSGDVYRNGYQAVGVLHRLVVDPDSATSTLLTVTPVLVAPLAACCLLLTVFGLRRSSGGVTALLAVLLGTVATLAAVQSGDDGAIVGVALSGPLVTLVGTVLACCGAIILLFVPRTYTGIKT